MENFRGERLYPNDQNSDPTAPPPSYSSVFPGYSDSQEFVPTPHFRDQPQLQQQTVVYQPVLSHQQPQTAVIVTGNPVMGPHPQMVHCPGCGESGESKIIHANNMGTHFCALVFCAVGCWCFSPLPYFVNGCRNKNHYCQHCNGFLGTGSAA